MAIHDAEVELRPGKALLGGHAEPLHRLGIILRNALSVAVLVAEGELCLSNALFGKRSPKPQRRRIIAALIGGKAILKRPRILGTCRCHQNGQRQKPASENCFHRLP